MTGPGPPGSAPKETQSAGGHELRRVQEQSESFKQKLDGLRDAQEDSKTRQQRLMDMLNELI